MAAHKVSCAAWLCISYSDTSGYGTKRDLVVHFLF